MILLIAVGLVVLLVSICLGTVGFVGFIIAVIRDWNDTEKYYARMDRPERKQR